MEEFTCSTVVDPSFFPHSLCINVLIRLFFVSSSKEKIANTNRLRDRVLLQMDHIFRTHKKWTIVLKILVSKEKSKPLSLGLKSLTGVIELGSSFLRIGRHLDTQKSIGWWSGFCLGKSRGRRERIQPFFGTPQLSLSLTLNNGRN